MILATHGILASYRGIDADAQAFITAANITDTTQQNAIKTLVSDLKSANIWVKMMALYPFVGGNASSHKWNLKDPRDLNAAYRLTFNGGWTHSSNGVLPNGTTGYANTYLNDYSQLVAADNHISCYVNTNGTSAEFPYIIGNYRSTSDSGLAIRTYGSSNGGTLRFYNYKQQDLTNTLSNNIGHWINSNKNGNFLGFKNNNVIINTSSTGVSANFNLYIGAIHIDGFPSSFSTQNIAFASIGNGLSTTEVANFYTAVQTFQTALGRQVV
jgi:hypothetical protein